jgi:glutathione S-transferase
MHMAMGIIDSYGYDALVGAAGYHLFPDFIGNPDEAFLEKSVKDARLVLTELMKIRGDSDYIAGDKPTLADFYLAPICFYVNLTDEAGRLFDVPGFSDWWDRMQQMDSFKSTEPNLG